MRPSIPQPARATPRPTSRQAWINIGLFVVALPPAALLIARTPSLGAARTSTLPAFDSSVSVDQHV